MNSHLLSRRSWALALGSVCLLLTLAGISSRSVAADELERAYTEVIDQPSLLTQVERTEIARMVADHNKQGLGLIKVLIVSRLPPSMSIEAYAARVLQDELSLSDRRADRVLLVLAIGERKVRIEVSSAIWSILPDQFCKKVIEREMTPQFRRTQYFAGLHAGLAALIGRLDEPTR